jgi:flavin reductase (DIM6/NTAB) family NADH-FMN oxidoreductase RutF
MRQCYAIKSVARSLAHSSIRQRSKHTHAHVHSDLRNLLRDTAQPVAIVTSLMPNGQTKSSSSSPGDLQHARFHGATLSSFSSIAMDPHPLVAFSLRIPSRMATALQLAQQHAHEQKTSHSNPFIGLPTHMVINILSSEQADLAVRFSRPDLHPRPFAEVPYHLTQEGLPVLSSSLGALSCKLVAASWPLHDLESLRHGRRGKDTQMWEGEGVASELFIGQVVRVEEVGDEGAQGMEEGRKRTPLLYYQRKYATIQDIHSASLRHKPHHKPPESE